MKKKMYLKPHIELIFVDNDFSLVLESTPPDGPNEVFNQSLGTESNNNFKIKTV